MTTIAEGLRKGRSHLIIAAALAIGGTLVVRIEDRTLNREAGKPVPHQDFVPRAVGSITMPMAPLPPAIVPTPAAVPATAAAPPASTPAPTQPAANTPHADRAGRDIQLGAFDSNAVAQERWSGLAQRFAILSSLDHSVETVSSRHGTVHRLIAAAPDLASARDVCAAVRRGGAACFVR